MLLNPCAPVVRKQVGDLHLSPQQRVQSPLVFMAIEPPQYRPPRFRVRGVRLCSQRLQERLAIRSRRLRSVARRHLAISHAIVNPHPPGVRRGIGEVVAQRRQVESPSCDALSWQSKQCFLSNAVTADVGAAGATFTPPDNSNIAASNG